MRKAKVGDRIRLKIPSLFKLDGRIVTLTRVDIGTSKQIRYWFDNDGYENWLNENQFELLADPFELWESA